MEIGRLLMPALRWRDATGFSHEEERIREALRLGAGGFIIFGGTRDGIAALTLDLRARAGRELLLASDLERGAGQQIEGLIQIPPPRALASLEDPAAIAWAGATTARDARSVGINWVFAPVADLDVLPDNPIVQSRAFGDNPQHVSRAVSAWIAACEGAGALSCAKHYPGHGRTNVDSHVSLPVVDADERTLAGDVLPFFAAVRAGVASLMTAHVAYPALDPSGLPATLSPAILARARADLGFDGLLVTDALIMEGALSGAREIDAAIAAVVAGCDILLYPSDATAVHTALTGAVATGQLTVRRLREALGRYDKALARAARPHEPPRATAGVEAEHIAARCLKLIRGHVPALRSPLELTLVDDDIGGPYPPIPTGQVRETLADLRVGMGQGGSRIVLVFAEPRAWKGRAGLGEATKRELDRALDGAALVVLFGHPRLADEIPGDVPILLAWHRQRLMQAAAAQRIAEML